MYVIRVEGEDGYGPIVTRQFFTDLNIPCGKHFVTTIVQVGYIRVVHEIVTISSQNEHSQIRSKLGMIADFSGNMRGQSLKFVKGYAKIYDGVKLPNALSKLYFLQGKYSETVYLALTNLMLDHQHLDILVGDF